MCADQIYYICRFVSLFVPTATVITYYTDMKSWQTYVLS